MRSLSLALLGLVVVAGFSHGGVLTFSPALTTDAASGIDPLATYTHAISGGETTTVNTVPFAVVDPGTTPPNFNWNTFAWSKNEVQNNNGNWNPATGGMTGAGLQDMFGDFAYSGTGNQPGRHQAFTLSGLTPGTTYDLRLYIRPWDVNYTGRTIDLTYTNGAEVDSTWISEDQPTLQGYPNNHSAYYISYQYTAQSASMSLDAAVDASGGGSFHMYAMTNQVVAGPYMVTNTAAGSTGFPVSDMDLLEGLVPTVNDLNLIRPEEGQTTNNPAALTNGLFGDPGLPGGANVNEVVAIHNGAVLTYVLDTLASPDGYDITEIATYSGWRDGGRDAQQYDVLYSLVSDPGAFLSLASVNYNPANGSPADTMVQMFLSDGGALLSGVAALRFSFPTTENGFVGYREFDVFGAPTAVIPEPATLALLAVGSLGLLRRRRRA